MATGDCASRVLTGPRRDQITAATGLWPRLDHAKTKGCGRREPAPHTADNGRVEPAKAQGERRPQQDSIWTVV